MDIEIFGFKIAPAIITFILGYIFNSAISLVKTFFARNNFNRFQNMVYLEYVDSDNIIGRAKEEVIRTNEDYVEKIDYLIKNELSHLKYSNKYQYIRLAEFTKMYLKEVLDIMGQYTFKNIDSEPFKHEIIELNTVQQYTKQLSKLYVERRKDYVEFKRDTFLTPKEKNRISLEYLNVLDK